MINAYIKSDTMTGFASFTSGPMLYNIKQLGKQQLNLLHW